MAKVFFGDEKKNWAWPTPNGVDVDGNHHVKPVMLLPCMFLLRVLSLFRPPFVFLLLSLCRVSGDMGKKITP